MRGQRRTIQQFQILVLSTLQGLLALSSTAQVLVMADGAVWNTCDGTFYDSGGAGGDYGNNEDLTATLCPGGGAGSGASTALHFLSFEAGSLDHLVIYDGISTTSPILATGDSNNSLAGQTFAAAGASGCLTFHWISDWPQNGSGWVADVITGPDAGANASLTVCSGQPVFPLFDALNGDPDVGGSWIGPGGPHGAQYDPGADPGGAYIYVVLDGSLCTDSATVTITNVPGPDAGEDGTLLICNISPPVEFMINSIGGTPDPGGTWTGPGGPCGGIFDPAMDPAGDYTYTVDGVSPCPDASATVTVTLTGAADAGLDGDLLACDTVTALQLINGLGGTPDAGGTWTDLDNTGALSGGTLNTIGLVPGAYQFQYTVAVAGCGSDDAVVTVQVLEGIEVIDFALDCDKASGTLVITFTIIHGDPATYSVEGVNGTITPGAPFMFTSDPLPDSLAVDVLVTDENGCGPVSLSVEPCTYAPHVFIPQSFSPNGDGINESFQITGLEDFPHNEIFIFNRWGAEVYHATEYHKRWKTWDGSAQNAHGDLPAGTYYYVLDLGNGDDPYRGFIYLNR